MIWKKKRRVDPDELNAQSEAATEQLRAQEPQVNALLEYLERRKNVNGFGTDFEFTFQSRGHR